MDDIAHDDDKLLTPRNLIAAVILVLFCLQTLLPYAVAIPEGRTGDLIANGAKVVETVLVMVLGAFFGDSLASRRKDRALAAVAAAPSTVISPGPVVAGQVTVSDIAEPASPPDPERP